MKPSIPKGTRDFSPVEMVKRNYIFKTIREVFEKYGYQPIETPAMENIETLTGKYGDEGDQLLFKILNSRQFEAKNKEDLKKEYEKSLEKNINSSLLTERALRYDLTVPFARYVVQHQNEITFPFKRYQIQPVWRADKPQKGRYREFYQCDADVIGSDSLLNEVEIVQMINDVYSRLGISVTIKINNRKILSGIAKYLGVKDDYFMDFVIAIDKIDKIGFEAVAKEINEKGMIDSLKAQETTDVNVLSYFKDALGKNPTQMKSYFSTHGVEIGAKGAEELEFIFSAIANLKSQISNLAVDYSLARGLNYYTGAIFEVKANDVQIGSICGGGRYDDLTGIFGLPNVSGVGISFGIDRIFDVMNELKLFDNIGLTASITKVLLVHFGEEERTYCIGVASQLRAAGINTEIYPDVTKKIAKQFDYANKKQILFVIVVGGDEMRSGELALKNMSSGEQMKMKVEQIISKLK
ncbi:MAG TPA: histidine--tRNA ligase [Bacteroidia bacterium]